ncbi:tetratricopeptide repeat protein [Roseiflexus sp.]|uniref:tetratricopeptide repeat protein n=1 Tax=Roseiflexus sp. TaxID=2562120 RepID=UPI00398B49C3
MALIRRFAPSDRSGVAHLLTIVGLAALALILRLLVWRWHELYPLGGDEQEYLNQALTLLRTRQYVELRLMRPPLYAIFLAACIVAFDFLIQNLRLVQAAISALTVVPIYLLTMRLFGDRRIAIIAGLLTALNYTLAFTATELLTETLFLFAGTIIFVLLSYTLSASRWQPLIAGICLGALALLRSVALPLLALGALWLALHAGKRAAATFVLAAVLVIAPWTVRNYLTYDGLILIDTTGAENLWLDNDPAGREAVKRQLYALGDDMAARQRLATERGVVVILDNPGHFAAKVWQQARLFTALQFFDDMRNRPAIWVPPLQVWLRLTLGDGLWLVILLGGAAGLWLAPTYRWTLIIAAPWTLYIALTTLIFHVEPRYRLPIYPALIPYAAWMIAHLSAWRTPAKRHIPAVIAAGATCAALITVTLVHRPYLSESWMLAQKHIALWQAQHALDQGRTDRARSAAETALLLDERSALARVALARADLADGDTDAALDRLNAALTAIPDHPYAHLLRGAVHRLHGNERAALRDLRYETASLEDLQRWAWDVFRPIAPPQERLDIGHLDLGYVRGFHFAEDGFRWTTDQAEILLAAQSGRMLELRLSGDRLPGAPLPEVRVFIDGIEVGRTTVPQSWRSIQFPLPDGTADDGQVVVGIQSTTYRPRTIDRTSPDNRPLGVAIDEARIVDMPE